MSSYCFVSIMGTQVMGTVNPLLSLIASGYDIRSVYILVTEKVFDISTRFEELCQRLNITLHVDMIALPSHIHNDLPFAHESVIKIANKLSQNNIRCIFNLNGGMNIQISQCALSLMAYNPLWIQATNDRILLDDAGSFSYLTPPTPLTTEDVLRLQGIKATPQTINTQFFTVKKFCAKANLALPMDSITDVNIGDVFFDLIWVGNNNRLNFVTSCIDQPEDKESRLAQERNISHWAASRYRSEHVFDRNVYVLTKSRNTVEHLTTESNGKILPIDVFGGWNNVKILREELKNIFSPKNMCIAQKISIKKRNAIKVLPNTLILCLGNNISPTLLCIASHAPQHVILCHSQELQEKAQRLREMHSQLGLESLRLITCNPEGNVLPACFAKPEQATSVYVNITPGTKGQGAYLALWGQQNGTNVCAIQPQTQEITILNSLNITKKTIPMVAPNPIHLLEARGERVQATAQDENEDIEKNAQLLHFLSSALKRPNAAIAFKKVLTIDNIGSLIPTHKKKILELKLVNDTVYTFNLKGGEWLESLTAQAFANAGAHHVYYRIRIAGSKKREAKIQIKHGADANSFLLDMDVLGSYAGGHFFVSCKSNPYADKHATVVEARSMARAIDRFTSIIVCHLDCHNPIFDEENRTMLIGWRELCQPEKLRDYLFKLRTYRPKFN